MGESGSNKQIGYLLRSYPRLSQTFILNEILALEKIGVSIQIFALTNPHEKVVQMQVDQVQAPIHYLDEFVQPRRFRNLLKQHAEVARLYFTGYIRTLFYLAANKAIDQGYTASNRWECWLQAVSFVHLLILQEQRTRKHVGHLHAHFAHDPTLVAYLVHVITGVPFSFTAMPVTSIKFPRKH